MVEMNLLVRVLDVTQYEEITASVSKNNARGDCVVVTSFKVAARMPPFFSYM